MAENVLTRIVADKRAHVERRKAEIPLEHVIAAAKASAPPRDFFSPLMAAHQAGRTALITEIKKASPSAGIIRADFNVPEIARAYHAAGASCLSVLTDTAYFQGQDAYLMAAKNACPLPALRKDFMIDPYQIAESRMLGADAVLLIMACLNDAEMRIMLREAAAYDLAILIEIHDEEELERYLALEVDTPKTMLGINNRNLKTLAIDLATTERLVKRIGDKRLVVGESGIKTRGDIERLKAAQVHCFLIGENLLKQADIQAATGALLDS